MSCKRNRTRISYQFVEQHVTNTNSGFVIFSGDEAIDYISGPPEPSACSKVTFDSVDSTKIAGLPEPSTSSGAKFGKNSAKIAGKPSESSSVKFGSNFKKVGVVTTGRVSWNDQMWR